jgi:hypothetical protein
MTNKNGILEKNTHIYEKLMINNSWKYYHKPEGDQKNAKTG